MNDMKWFEEMEKVLAFINDHKDFYVALDKIMFEPLICMLMEEYCKENKLDIVAETRDILTAVEQVNAELGAY